MRRKKLVKDIEQRCQSASAALSRPFMRGCRKLYMVRTKSLNRIYVVIMAACSLCA
jgi:hypothetical protein